MPATPYFCLTKLFESGKINLCLDIFNFKKAIYPRKAQKLRKKSDYFMAQPFSLSSNDFWHRLCVILIHS